MRQVSSIETRNGASAASLCRNLRLSAMTAIPALAAAILLAGSPSAGDAKAAVFGKDERRMLAGRQKFLRDRIGVLEHRGTGAVCTAFCVAENVVATAGHCVVGTASQPGSRPWMLRFRRDNGRGAITGISGAATQTVSRSIVTGAAHLSTRPPINATSDWALLRLERPVCPAGGFRIGQLSLEDVAANAAAGLVYHVAYHRDLAHWQLAIGKSCPVIPQKRGREAAQVDRDFERPEHLILHTCDTEAASSGSPLLIDGDNGPEVVGINVGTYVRSRVITHDGEVVHRLASEVVANTALLAAPLAPHIDELVSADIIEKREDVTRLQRLLGDRGFAVGEIDGRIGDTTRAAIRAYEKSVGLPVTGHATRGLLSRLENARPATASR